MDEIIAKVAAAAGIDASVAEKAIGAILGFLKKEGPADHVATMMEKLPGADDLIAKAPSGGMFGAMGGIMGLGSQLMSSGLSMGQVQTVGRTLFASAREQVGEETMGQIVASIPGLSQFV